MTARTTVDGGADFLPGLAAGPLRVTCRHGNALTEPFRNHHSAKPDKTIAAGCKNRGAGAAKLPFPRRRHRWR
jgi:hypothetical protein